MHYWGVWHGLHPFSDFRKYKARFMSEYGFQSFPEYKSVQKYTIPADYNIESEVMASHQRSGIGNLRIVLGKFLGAYALVALVVVIALAMPLALHFGTDMDLGRLAAAALGLVLYASALTAIGIACSAWTSHPALAAAAALVIGSFLAMLDMGARFQGIDNALINWLSLSTHLEPFLFGLVASVDIVYFLLLTTLALLFAGRRLDGLRAHG